MKIYKHISHSLVEYCRHFNFIIAVYNKHDYILDKYNEKWTKTKSLLDMHRGGREKRIDTKRD